MGYLIFRHYGTPALSELCLLLSVLVTQHFIYYLKIHCGIIYLFFTKINSEAFLLTSP
jgi:hypothetical protein